MAKRSSARIDQELSEKSELRCMWAGLFSIHPSPYKLFSNRRPVKTNDNSRKLDDQLASFDEECQKTQNEEANLASVRNLILDDMYIDSHKNNQIRVKGQQLTKTDSELMPHPVKTQKATRKESQRAYQSSSNAGSLNHQQPSTSPHVDEKIVQQAKMSVKAFIDQMFVDGKFVRSKERTSSESMPISDALQVLSTNNKDLFMELFVEPNSHSSTRRNHQKSNGKPTTFSIREIKQKLKHTFGDFRKEPNQFPTNGGTSSRKLLQKRSKFGDDCNFRVVDTRDPLNSSPNAKTKEKVGTKLEIKSDRGSDIACLNENVRKKIDFSSSRFSKKREIDVALETKRRHMSARLKSLNAISGSKRSPKTLRTILSPTEQELLLLRPRRVSQHCSGYARTRLSSYSNFPSPNERQRTRLSPPRTYTEVISCDDYEEYDDTTECLSTETNYEAHDINISETGNMRSNGEPQIVETKNICHSDCTAMHSIPDSISENETFTSTVDDLQSTPTSLHVLSMSETIKYQEEHQSPVSVLEQFFSEDANNNITSNVMLQTGRKRSQPRHIYFKDYSIESSPQDQPVSENPCNDEQDYISQYMRLVLRASCLNWDKLSRISPRSEELLQASLFDEVEFLSSNFHFDPKILFDHMNEVLLQIHQSHFSFFPWPAFGKPENSSVSLDELVLDEIMRKASEFYLLPRIEEITVDQLVANDVSDSRSWIDVRPEAERIMIHISEDILEESVLDIILGFHS